MKRLLFPMRVTPPPCTVPRLTVLNSRNRLPSPITTSVCSPPNFRSWGSPPTELNESKTFLRPMRAGPRTTACGSRMHPSPSSTSSPTTANAPMRALAAIRALGATTAWESTSFIAHTHRVRRRRVAGGGRFAIDQHAAQYCLRGNIAIHRGDSLELAEFDFPFQDGYLDAQLVSRNYRAAEARFVHSGEKEKFFVALLNLGH